MTKIVLNGCYGGFGLSEAAYKRYAEIAGLTLYPEKHYSLTMYYLDPQVEDQRDVNRRSLYARDLDRTDPILVQVVEELGSDAAGGKFSELFIEEMPKGTQYRINEYDGMESLETREDIECQIA